MFFLFSHLHCCDYFSLECVFYNIIVGKCDIISKHIEFNVQILFILLFFVSTSRYPLIYLFASSLSITVIGYEYMYTYIKHIYSYQYKYTDMHPIYVHILIPIQIHRYLSNICTCTNGILHFFRYGVKMFITDFVVYSQGKFHFISLMKH